MSGIVDELLMRPQLLHWHPIEVAPLDRAVLVYAPAAHGLPDLMSVCRWHEDAGWCIDELREPTHWMPLPRAPTEALPNPLTTPLDDPRMVRMIDEAATVLERKE